MKTAPGSNLLPPDRVILGMERQVDSFILIALLAIVGLNWCVELGQAASAIMTFEHSNLLPDRRIMYSMDTETLPGENSICAQDGAEEAVLVERARNGDQEAYAGLYHQHAPWLLPMLWRLTGGDRGRAEELLQDAFVRAWEKLGQLRDPARFGGWLKQTTVHLALADRRRLKPVMADLAMHAVADIEPPWPASDLDLERAVAQLPERARHVLVLFCLEGYSHEEIATTLGVEIGTSKAQLHRARALLKENLS